MQVVDPPSICPMLLSCSHRMVSPVNLTTVQRANHIVSSHWHNGCLHTFDICVSKAQQLLVALLAYTETCPRPDIRRSLRSSGIISGPPFLKWLRRNSTCHSSDGKP